MHPPGYASVSADEHIEFAPELSGPIMKAWDDGILSLTKDEALGDDKLLIRKTPDQPFVKAVQLKPTMVRLMPLCKALNMVKLMFQQFNVQVISLTT